MRRHQLLYILAAAVLLAAAGSGRAALTLALQTDGGSSSASLWPGDTLSMRTYLAIGGGETVGGLFYTVDMIGTNWQMTARSYAANWEHNDGFYDSSAPIPGATTFPVGITDTLCDLTPSTPDFSFSTVRVSGNPMLVSGEVETFALTVPTGLTPGDHTLSFGYFDAYDDVGTPLGSLSTVSFTLTVIPEPAAGLLAALGLGFLILYRPRRRVTCLLSRSGRACARAQS